MPSTSKKQARFMQAVANSPKFAKKVNAKTANTSRIENNPKLSDELDNQLLNGGDSSPERHETLL